MNYKRCREILRKYFSNIVYIDDVFDTSLITEHEFEVDSVEKEAFGGGTPLPSDIAEGSNLSELTTPPPEIAGEQKINPLADLLIALSHYREIRLTPVFFNSPNVMDLAVSKMRTSPLTIIDWDLGAKLDAYDVIKELFNQTSQLKVIVIYTNGFHEASQGLDQKLGKGQYRPISLQSNSERIKCVQYDKSKSLIMIADKTSINLKQIFTTIEECFLDSYGTMPVALLDMAAQIEQKSGKLFGAFCAPLDGLYFLQNYYTSEDKHEFQSNLTTFVINKVKADVEADEAIIDEIFEYMRERLISLASMDSTELSNLLKIRAELLKGKLPNHLANYCDGLAQIPPEKFKSSTERLRDIEPANWQSVLNEFSENMGIQGANRTYKQQIWPLFVQSLISGEGLLNSGAELIENLQYHRYDNPSLTELLSEGMNVRDNGRETFLVNKLHFGDILVSSDQTRFLLCVTPPCDIYRPKKTGLNISYIAGTVASKENQKNITEGQHLCLYPKPNAEGDENSVIYIKWHFYKGVRYDLSDDDQFAEFCSHTREYRLDEQYTRQIANKYIAYYSRAGVNELFIKENDLHRDIWGQ